MLKLFYFFGLVVTVYGTIIKVPGESTQFFITDSFISENEDVLQTKSLLIDIVKLLDFEKLLHVLVKYVDDAEVMNFIIFIFGPEFKEITWELQTLEEFQEAYTFLATKGYDMKSVIDFLNAVFELPPFNKPQKNLTPNKGMSGFIVDFVAALPMEDIKNLISTKLENNDEAENLIAVLDSQELKMILMKLVENPKFKEFKAVFESHGVDIKYFCTTLEEVISNFYPGIFYCNENFELHNIFRGLEEYYLI